MRKSLLPRSGAGRPDDADLEPTEPITPCLERLFDAVHPGESAVVRDPEPNPSPPPRAA